MTKNTVCIIGAGAAGLTLACLLARTGMGVTVFDHALPASGTKRSDNRTAALLRPSVHVLARAGVMAEDLPDTAPLRHLSLVDIPARANGDTARAHFSADEIGEPYFALNIRNDELHGALLERARTHKNITIIAPIKVQNITADDFGASVHTDKGDYRFQLVIGADGKNSRVRDIAGIGCDTSDYSQVAITCMISHTRAHRDTSVEFHRPGGPFTIVPLAGGKRSSIVWMEDAAVAADILSLPPAEFERRLADETCGEVGDVTVMNPPQSWPITLQIAHKLTARRIALMAEAAHALPPSGAQGLNLSLRDADMLADTLAQSYACGLDLGGVNALRQYERARRADIMPRAYAVDGLNRLILSDNKGVRLMRRWGLMAAASISPLRRTLMRFGWAPA